MKKQLFVSLFLVLLLLSCSKQKSVEVMNAEVYLESLGYEVVSFENESTIILKQSHLLSLPDKNIWAVQTVDPNAYLNKEIQTVSFFIKNHPLDHMFEMGKTYVTVFLFNGNVIGGWSAPHSKEPITGGYYSIDGKTIEDLHEDLQKWEEKYR